MQFEVSGCDLIGVVAPESRPVGNDESDAMERRCACWGNCGQKSCGYAKTKWSHRAMELWNTAVGRGLVDRADKMNIEIRPRPTLLTDRNVWQPDAFNGM